MTGTGSFRPELLAPLVGDLAAHGRTAEIPVCGTSMCPSLLHGDRVRLVPATGEEVRIGDVVVGMGETGPIIHRVVGWWRVRDSWRILTKGDAARWLDPPLHPGSVVARVVARVRNDQVRRLDGMGMRLRGRGRAAFSLLLGLVLEAWLRGCRAIRHRNGWPEG